LLIEAVIEARLVKPGEFAVGVKTLILTIDFFPLSGLGWQAPERSPVYGFPCGSLSQEMGKSDDQLARKLQRFFAVSWSGYTHQFCLLGKVKKLLTWLLIW